MEDHYIVILKSYKTINLFNCIDRIVPTSLSLKRTFTQSVKFEYVFFLNKIGKYSSMMQGTMDAQECRHTCGNSCCIVSKSSIQNATFASTIDL
jgi:hypothetical protein